MRTCNRVASRSTERRYVVRHLLELQSPSDSGVESSPKFSVVLYLEKLKNQHSFLARSS